MIRFEPTDDLILVLVFKRNRLDSTISSNYLDKPGIIKVTTSYSTCRYVTLAHSRGCVKKSWTRNSALTVPSPTGKALQRQVCHCSFVIKLLNYQWGVSCRTTTATCGIESIAVYRAKNVAADKQPCVACSCSWTEPCIITVVFRLYHNEDITDSFAIINRL